MIVKLDYHNMLVAFDKRYDLAEFRRVSQVSEGSYADELVVRIHECLFEYPKDIIEEYYKYYSIEYLDFAKFLYWKYAVSSDIAQTINDRANKSAYIGYGRNTLELFEDETFDAILNSIFKELGEQDYESKD